MSNINCNGVNAIVFDAKERFKLHPRFKNRGFRLRFAINNQKGIVHILIPVIVISVILVVVAHFLLKSSAINKTPDAEKRGSTTNPTPAGEIKTDQLDEAFGEKKEYSNPFEEGKNPFDYLNE